VAPGQLTDTGAKVAAAAATLSSGFISGEQSFLARPSQ
jgi:hypothetical protein